MRIGTCMQSFSRVDITSITRLWTNLNYEGRLCSALIFGAQVSHCATPPKYQISLCNFLCNTISHCEAASETASQPVHGGHKHKDGKPLPGKLQGFESHCAISSAIQNLTTLVLTRPRIFEIQRYIRVARSHDTSFDMTGLGQTTVRGPEGLRDLIGMLHCFCSQYTMVLCIHCL